MKNKGYAKFWAANKVHYGRCASGVLRSFPSCPFRASPLSPGFPSCHRPRVTEWGVVRNEKVALAVYVIYRLQCRQHLQGVKWGSHEEYFSFVITWGRCIFIASLACGKKWRYSRDLPDNGKLDRICFSPRHKFQCFSLPFSSRDPAFGREDKDKIKKAYLIQTMKIVKAWTGGNRGHSHLIRVFRRLFQVS